MRLVIEAERSGTRTDVLVARLTGASRSLVAAAIRRGAVTVNGETVKPSRVLEAGDTLDFEVAAAAKIVALPEPVDLAILYEDDDLLVVDKPAGMVTHPAHGTTGGTLLNALLAHAGSLPGEPLRAGLVHRLDRDTSGLLVVAKTAQSLATLRAAMLARTIRRQYLGLVHGIPSPSEGTLNGPIGRDPQNRLRYTILADGRAAVTHYALREAYPRHAELLFQLETGRTHQIRVHLAAFGHPIVNDPVYGRPESRFALAGQALHAWRLAFPHPRTQAELSFEADPPAEYLGARELLRG
ncbi:MAG: RluA family pseudouridine synthase [Vulcanimicrobiaceae bacterium]